MMYGSCILLEPFLLAKSPQYKQQLILENKIRRQMNDLLMVHSTTTTITTETLLLQSTNRIHPMMPLRNEKMLLTLSFMLCVAVGIAIFFLGGFHIYLIVTAQTTIEFHGNFAKKREAKSKKKKWLNPYSINDNYRYNWSQVYGWNAGQNIFTILRSLVPSSRPPDYYPAPVPGNSLRKAVVMEAKINRIHPNNHLMNGSAAAAFGGDGCKNENEFVSSTVPFGTNDKRTTTTSTTTTTAFVANSSKEISNGGRNLIQML